MMTVKDFRLALAELPDNMLIVFDNDGEWVTFTGIEPNDTILVEGQDKKKVHDTVAELY